MIKYIVSIIGLCGLSTMALAQQWVAISGQGATVEMDRASVISVSNGIQAWSRITQSRQILGPEDGFMYRRLVQLNEYRCGNRSYAPLQQMYFNDAGLLVKEQRYSEPDDEQRIIPGTPEDRMYKLVCPPDNQSSGSQSTLARSPQDRIKSDLKDQNARSGSQSTVASIAPSARTNQPAASQPAASRPSTQASNTANNQSAKPVTQAAVQPETKTAQTAASSQPTTGMASFLSRILPTRTPAQQPSAVAVAPVRKPATTLGQVEHPAVVPSAADAAPRARQQTVTETKQPQSVAQAAPQKTPQTVAQASQQKPAEKPATTPVNLDTRPTGSLPWLYQSTSQKGPNKWSTLSSANKLCSAGLMQAPIDIRNPVVADMDPIRFDSKATPLKIMDTGNTIMVKVDPGLSLSWQGVKYDLLYYTFHNPSEVQVDGKASEMSIHFVHRSLQGKVTVLAVPVKIGKENPAIRQIWNNLPLEVGIEVTPKDVLVNPRDIIDAPDSVSDVVARSANVPNRLKGYYVFVGSLSTPPCTEGVLWLVLKEPVEISQEQLNAFTRLYRNNVRPIQPTRGRLVKVTRY